MVAGAWPARIGRAAVRVRLAACTAKTIKGPPAFDFDRTPAMTLDELRRDLDELDRRLLQTIAERQATSREIARVKRATGYPTRDFARERDVIVGARSNAASVGVSP